jgi:hypothetical protein
MRPTVVGDGPRVGNVAGARAAASVARREPRSTMARIGIVTELPGETRVAASPTTVGLQDDIGGPRGVAIGDGRAGGDVLGIRERRALAGAGLHPPRTEEHHGPHRHRHRVARRDAGGRVADHGGPHRQARLQERDLVGGRHRDLQDDIGGPRGVAIGDGRAGGDVLGI